MNRALNALSASVFLFLLCGGVAYFVLVPDGRLIHLPLHVFVETMGAFTALLIALLIIMLKVYGRLPVRYIWVVSALVGMGTLDGFHALSADPHYFMLFHSLAMLLGGVMATLVWIPDRIARQVSVYRLQLLTMVLALLLGVSIPMLVSSLPMISSDQSFTPQANLINSLAGLLFLVAAVNFLCARYADSVKGRTIFATHYLLLAMSGLMFQFSFLWDVLWWHWHLLRFTAYLMVLFYLFLFSRSEERQLLALNTKLEEQVLRRTSQLNRELRARKRIEKRLKHQATHDPLTGLYNRNELERRIADDLARASRYNHPISIFMVDIDHFKDINDRYGHVNGDRVLCRVADELERSLRKTDYVARYGGEEFLIVLPETPLAMAVELGERLRHQVASQRIDLAGTSVSVTVSIGVASYPEIDSDRHKLLDAADMAMYQAKHDGRNCLRSAVSSASLSS
ncbi:GGDEF domain-containing protein [Sedimenticola thiotaurini]|uniref:GGDEF domain-containing protein n=1 Tax=Sedimenticola thiotaurini TaxID=1543721 RepID=UPI000699A36B|nr:GGDEF domain-containing protein [Sedimenticola thiotaurini]